MRSTNVSANAFIENTVWERRSLMMHAEGRKCIDKCHASTTTHRHSLATHKYVQFMIIRFAVI